jgi:hypothetical protein
MDGMLRMLLGSHRWDVAQRAYPRVDRAVDRSSIPVTPRTMEARKMVLYLLWLLILSAPLIALTLTAGCTPLQRTVSETRFVATASDATAAAEPEEAAGKFWKREHSREIKIWRGGIVSIIEREGPLDEELTVGRPVDHTASP